MNPSYEIIVPGNNLRLKDDFLGMSSITLVRTATEWMLFDTGGYISRLGLLKRLRERGLEPRDIGTVFLSHLHFDHAHNIDLFRHSRIVVSRKAGTLSVYDSQDELVALFTVTTGSQHDPLPLGKWKINGIDRNPKYHYNPALFWDVSDAKPEAMLPPGPNSPVGVVWIDLSKPHYGIHGTPEPAAIGKSESHGCVRLTNWDAARLSEMVDQQTQVEFVA